MKTSGASLARPRQRMSIGRLQLGVVRDYGIVVAFVTLFLVLCVASDAFLTRSNLINVLEQSAAVGIIACAGTLVIIAGGFDLSVGAVFAFAGVIAAKLGQDVGPLVALAGGAAAGVVIGMGNGVMTTVGRINPFIATLASSIIVRGAAIAITGGFLITVTDERFAELGRAEVIGIPYSVLIWLVFAGACGVVLSRSIFGRHIYASGSNAEAAKLAGVRVGLTRLVTFAVSGFAAGLAGVIVASRAATGQSDAGVGLEFAAIAAIVIGGTSILGGEGAIWRTMLGVLFVALIGNGFNLLGVDPVYQQIVQGAIILAAVGLDAWARRSST